MHEYHFFKETDERTFLSRTMSDGMLAGRQASAVLSRAKAGRQKRRSSRSSSASDGVGPHSTQTSDLCAAHRNEKKSVDGQSSRSGITESPVSHQNLTT